MQKEKNALVLLFQTIYSRFSGLLNFVEAAAEQRLLSMLPEEFQDDFAPFLISGTASKEEQSIVKQADSICAYLKCLEELSAGNHEYEQAKRRLEETLEQRKSPEMDYFLTTFAPSFELSLDEIS